MTTLDPTAVAVNAVATVPYIVLIVAIAFKQLMLILDHRKEKTRRPELLDRDALLFWALVIIIAVPSVFAAFGIRLGDYLAWVIFRSVVGIFVLTVWAYYEYLRIGKESE